MDFKKRNPIIFVVSGKASSGKDTTCNFINNCVKLKGLTCVNLQFSSYIKNYAKVISNWDGEEITKPRKLLQTLGTEIIRDKIDDNFFINRIIEDIKVYSYYFDVITISDARLPKELDGVYNSFDNVYKLRIIRPEFENNLRASEKAHITEVSLDNYDSYQYKIINDGSLNDLDIKVNKMIDEVL